MFRAIVELYHTLIDAAREGDLRLHLHAWRIRHNEEDATPYEQCVRCHAERDVQLRSLGAIN